MAGKRCVLFLLTAGAVCMILAHNGTVTDIYMHIQHAHQNYLCYSFNDANSDWITRKCTTECKYLLCLVCGLQHSDIQKMESTEVQTTVMNVSALPSFNYPLYTDPEGNQSQPRALYSVHILQKRQIEPDVQQGTVKHVFFQLYSYLCPNLHRKILKVGGAKDMIARSARAKIFRPRPLWVKPRPFLNDRRYCD